MRGYTNWTEHLWTLEVNYSLRCRKRDNSSTERSARQQSVNYKGEYLQHTEITVLFSVSFVFLFESYQLTVHTQHESQRRRSE